MEAMPARCRRGKYAPRPENPGRRAWWGSGFVAIELGNRLLELEKTDPFSVLESKQK
jgi:phage gp46-like protein